MHQPEIVHNMATQKIQQAFDSLFEHSAVKYSCCFPLWPFMDMGFTSYTWATAKVKKRKTVLYKLNVYGLICSLLWQTEDRIAY